MTARADLDAAASSVWLHGDWRWLTRNMTTDEREAFADACDRHNNTAPPDDRVSPVERWWRDDAPLQPQQQRASGHAYLVIHAGGGIGLADPNPDRAHEYARNTGSVVVSAPIAADYRTPGGQQ
jgi:hypothetical protein